MNASWPCPRCACPTSRVDEAGIKAWRCDACSLTWVTGSTVAELAGRPSEFRAIVDAAAAAPASTRSFNCPQCRNRSLHEVKVRRVPVDVCDTCGGFVLDPGEAKALARLSSTGLSNGGTFADTVAGADALLQVVGLIAKATNLVA